MTHLISLSRKRVLLRGPGCKVWFLGEMIHSWHLGARVRRPPLPPLHHIFWAHLLEGEELDRACEGEDAMDFCKRVRS